MNGLGSPIPVTLRCGCLSHCSLGFLPLLLPLIPGLNEALCLKPVKESVTVDFPALFIEFIRNLCYFVMKVRHVLLYLLSCLSIYFRVLSVRINQIINP